MNEAVVFVVFAPLAVAGAWLVAICRSEARDARLARLAQGPRERRDVRRLDERTRVALAQRRRAAAAADEEDFDFVG